MGAMTAMNAPKQVTTQPSVSTWCRRVAALLQRSAVSRSMQSLPEPGNVVAEQESRTHTHGCVHQARLEGVSPCLAVLVTSTSAAGAARLWMYALK